MVEYKIADGWNSFTAEGMGIEITADKTFSTDDEGVQRMLDSHPGVERVGEVVDEVDADETDKAAE
jgi:hypothetical protein